MPIVCGIRFRGTGKIYYFSPCELDLAQGDHVVVETSRGQEIAQVALPAQDVEDDEVVGQLKPVIRRATTADLLDAETYRKQEDDALDKCREQVQQTNLPMKVVSAEYNYDGSRLTFFFTSEQRVDFRELVRDLARLFRTRIELRQIGVRDESKIVGGVGRCGRPLCCATWMNDFVPVSIRMAKQQDLPLSPMEISGLCGRLLCCLSYENDYYCEVKKRFPRVGKIVEIAGGRAKVIGVNVLTELAMVLLDDGTTMELTLEQLTAEAPIDCAHCVPGDIQDAPQEAMSEPEGEELQQDPERGAVIDEDAPLAEETPQPKRSPRSRSRRRPRAKSMEQSVGEGMAVSEEQGASPEATQEPKPRSRRRPSRRSSRQGDRDGDSTDGQENASAGPSSESGAQSKARSPRRRGRSPRKPPEQQAVS